jgi:hypothetical protein
MVKVDFSDEFETWYQNNRDKNVEDLLEFFGEKSFAMLFLLFMFIPALPVPTGGITTLVLLPGTMIAAAQMMFGRHVLWLPRKVNKMKLKNPTIRKSIPFMISRIRWLEKYSEPRFVRVFESHTFNKFAGFSVFILALAALIAPPFSWLDTLPSFGAVFIALSIILEDFVLYVLGMIIGAFGIALLVAAIKLFVVFIQTLL